MKHAKNKEYIEGFVIPIHKSLTEEIMVGGVPRTMALLLGTFAAAFGLGMHSPYILPGFFALYIGGVIVSKYDPQFLQCVRRNLRYKKYYST